MVDSYRQMALPDVLELQRGFDLPATARRAGCVPVVASTSVVGRHDTAMVRGPGVVIGRSGSIGGAQWIETDFWPLNTTLWVKDFRSHDPRWAYYLLKSLNLSYLNAGSGVPTLNRNHLSNVRVHVPGPVTQRAIAEVLGALDDKIEANRRQSAIASELAMTLLRDWFAEYGPVRAKESGGDAYLASDLWDLFPEGFDEHGRPIGWAEQPFGDLLLDHQGGDWGKDAPSTNYDAAVCIIRGTDLADVVAGDVGKVPTRYTTGERALRRALRDGDVIVEVSGGSPTQPTGRSLFITESILDRFPHPVVCASFCRRLRPVNLENGLLAALHLASLYAAGGTWGYQNQSTGISNFQTTRFLSDNRVTWPGEELVHAFAGLVEPLVRLATRNENLALAALRDALLPKLLSGKLTVRNVEALGESAQ